MDPVDAAVLRATLATWEGDDLSGCADPGGRLFARWVDLDPADPGWNDWSLIPPDETPRQVPAGAAGPGWYDVGEARVQWVRTRLPDGPHTGRLGDILAPEGA